MGRRKRSAESGHFANESSENDQQNVETIEYEINGKKEQIIVKNEYNSIISDLDDLEEDAQFE